MSIDVLRQHVLPHLQRIRPAGGGQWKAACPVRSHGRGNGDRNPSLSIGPGRDQALVFRCHAGCDQADVKQALIDLGINWNLISTPGAISTAAVTVDTWMPCGHARVASYDYRDADGIVRYGTARCALKGHGCPGFAYWRPDPGKRSGRRWSLNERDADGNSQRMVPHLPYRLPEALRAIEQGRTAWITEGEKDADRLATIGIAAVCNDGGAGKWNASYADYLTAADVVIVADRDAPGRAHAQAVVDTLMPLARSIEVIQAAHGKDASDHLDAGGSIGSFVTVAVPIPAPVAVTGRSDC